ncbi:hypothetical protein SAMN05421874_111104 [Nonomuraea maritima]|uniref:Uncharacterized protein n=1 Tax=Nonomuraea maritima TaxID=683260 RepID=A0A1G9ERW7_9ACTN|nr:hypothetical protein SAMN05421874_111104 [Nonomuraea maritima]
MEQNVHEDVTTTATSPARPLVIGGLIAAVGQFTGISLVIGGMPISVFGFAVLTVVFSVVGLVLARNGTPSVHGIRPYHGCAHRVVAGTGCAHGRVRSHESVALAQLAPVAEGDLPRQAVAGLLHVQLGADHPSVAFVGNELQQMQHWTALARECFQRLGIQPQELLEFGRRHLGPESAIAGYFPI